MTDDEIIKSFLCCDNGFCGDCSYQSEIMCATELKREVLDLLERQKKEINRLTKRNFDLSEKGEKVAISLKTVKRDVLKEFIARLEALTLTRYGLEQDFIFPEDIDRVLEEMGVEVNDGV